MTDKQELSLKVDPERVGIIATGIFVRAKDPDGKSCSADIADLTADSLVNGLSSKSQSTPHLATQLLQTVLGHGDPAMRHHGGARTTEEALVEAETAKRVQTKLVDRANTHDALVSGLTSEIMKFSLDVLDVLDEPYSPVAISSILFVVSSNAARTKTGRTMWKKYRDENASDAVAEFSKRITDEAQQHKHDA